jgi:hypothetical protein
MEFSISMDARTSDTKYTVTCVSVTIDGGLDWNTQLVITLSYNGIADFHTLQMTTEQQSPAGR